MFTHVKPPETTVARFCQDVFDLAIEDDRVAASLSADEVWQLHQWLIAQTDKRRVPSIGCIDDILAGHYAKVTAMAHIGGAWVPYCVEAWADCERAERGYDTDNTVTLLLNRSPSVALVSVDAPNSGLWLRGCGLNQTVSGKRADYDITLSVIAPYFQLMGDGKAPLLLPFREAIGRAVQKAASAAYRAMVKPKGTMSMRAAARQVMAKAYQEASGKLGMANARQVMSRHGLRS